MKESTPKEQAVIYGKALMRLRKRANLSQQAAAAAIEATQQTWHRYEHASNQAYLDVSVQRKTVEALGFTLDDLEYEAQAVTEGRPLFEGPKTPPRLRDGPTEPAWSGNVAQFPAVKSPARERLLFPLDGVVRASPVGVAVYDAGESEEFDFSAVLTSDTRVLRVGGDSVYPFAASGGYVTYRVNGAPRRDDGVVIRYKDGQFFLKKFVRVTGTHVECIQYDAEIVGGRQAYFETPVTYPLSEVEAIYQVVARV